MNICKIFEVRPPNVYVMKTPTVCANPDLVIGLELETEQCNRWGGGTYGEIANRYNFNIETDGSLRGNAYEFISRPMKSTHALTALTGFFKEMGFTAENYSDRCSVHVHVNCTDMTTEQISNVSLLYSMTEDILFEFVGADRDTNIFCVPWNQCRAQVDLVERFLSDPNSALRGWNKYTALNLIPLKSQGTIEFRQMHGTSDMEKLTTWINILGCMFSFATNITLKDLIGRIKDLNTSSQYEQFFQELFKGYLPYNEVYKLRMEEGVILAKFSLLNHKEERPLIKKVEKKTTARGAVPAGIANAQFNYFLNEGEQVRNAPPPAPMPIDDLMRQLIAERDMIRAQEQMRNEGTVRLAPVARDDNTNVLGAI